MATRFLNVLIMWEPTQVTLQPNVIHGDLQTVIAADNGSIDAPALDAGMRAWGGSVTAGGKKVGKLEMTREPGSGRFEVKIDDDDTLRKLRAAAFKLYRITAIENYGQPDLLGRSAAKYTIQSVEIIDGPDYLIARASSAAFAKSLHPHAGLPGQADARGSGINPLRRSDGPVIKTTRDLLKALRSRPTARPLTEFAKAVQAGKHTSSVPGFQG